MGALFACGSRKKSSNKNDVKQKESVVSKDTVVSKEHESEPSDVSESSTNIHSPEEILDENFKNQITEAIDESMASLPTAYQTEHDRVLKEMERLAPQSYLGLRFSEYPDGNGPILNEMVRRVVTSNEVKQRIIDLIDERIESSFQSRTADWDSSSREIARPVIKTFIEKLVNEAFDRVQLP